MLASSGVATNLFVQSGNSIKSVPLDGSKPTRIYKAADKRMVVAFAASATGERLAVASTGEENPDLQIQILDGKGKGIATADLPNESGGSPVPSGGGRYELEWAPNANRLLVSMATGGIVEVSDAGKVRTILRPQDAPSPRAVTWSPSGGAIAYVDAGADGSATGLYVASTDVLPVDPVAVIRPIQGRSRQIVDIAWAAGGSGILYAERAPSGDLSVGGDLFVVSPAGGKPQLVGSAGGVSQVAAVGTFSVAPDGRAVAYTVVMPGANGPAVGALKVRQIGGPTSLDLPLQNVVAIDAVDWTSGGLSWAATVSEDGKTEGIVVQRAMPDGSVQTLYSDVPQATPAASPIASPAASPSSDATPVSS